jgi:hypothetical protein
MASRNGLNPKIKGPKGVGFGRALPSAFGFGNGIQPPGNGYLNISTLIGTAIPPKWTIEFWILPQAQMPNFEGWIQYNDGYTATSGGEIRLQGQPASYAWFQFLGNTTGISFDINIPSQPIIGVKNHIVFTIDTISLLMTCVINGNTVEKAITEITLNTNPYLGIYQLFNLFVLTTQGVYASILTDEYRMYSEALTDIDIATNYNGGLGNNPVKTETLFVWYIFEKFEIVDFSKLQDGSDMRIGMRDQSGKNNHAQPINLDTNINSSTYVIKPFQ